MREIKVEKKEREIIIIIGTAVQGGDYKVLKLLPEEAAVLMMELKNKL